MGYMDVWMADILFQQTLRNNCIRVSHAQHLSVFSYRWEYLGVQVDQNNEGKRELVINKECSWLSSNF
jgi:hypothetical protein